MKKEIKRYYNKILKILKKPEMSILPSNIAFNIILAIIPLLTIVVLIADSFGISIDVVVKLVESIMPSQASSIITSAISGKGFDSNVGLFNLTAFIIASNGMYALIETSDALYNVKEKDTLKKRVSSIIILLIVLTLFVFLLIVPIFGENILNLLRHIDILNKHIDNAIILFNFIKWPTTLFIMYFNIRLIYTIAPSKNIKSKEATPGAIFTTIMWSLLTIFFSFYLRYFSKYDIIYGNLSSIIIMMVWIYALSYIFTLGMAINITKKDKSTNEEDIKTVNEKN